VLGHLETEIGEKREQLLQCLHVLGLAADCPPTRPVADDVVGDDRRDPFQIGRAGRNTGREKVTICAPLAPKLPATLSHLKQIPVRILEPRGVTPGELEDLGWLELHSARLQRLEHHPDIFHLDRVNR
jgi:hypothetical protein